MKGKLPKQSRQIEDALGAVERLFGERLQGPCDCYVRDLLAVLWPLGATAAREKATELALAAHAGLRRAQRPLTSDGLSELGIPAPAGCPDWFMHTPVVLACMAADRAEHLIGAFVDRAARPWAAREGVAWCKEKRCETQGVLGQLLRGNAFATRR